MKLLDCKQNMTQWINALLFSVSKFRDFCDHRFYLRLQRKYEATPVTLVRNCGRELHVEIDGT